LQSHAESNEKVVKELKNLAERYDKVGHGNAGVVGVGHVPCGLLLWQQLAPE
jgi:hypothetical protein